MHLALIISSLESGGAERVLTSLANYWAKQGHRVSLLIYGSSGEGSFYPLDPRVSLLPLNLKGTPKAGAFARVGLIAKRLLTLRRTLQALKPDRILSFTDIMNITVLIATRGMGIPVVVSERTTPQDHGIPFIYQLLRKYFYPVSKKVVFQTPSAQKFFMFLKNSAIIPNFVPPTPLHKGDKAFKGQFVSVGRLCPNKGFDTLIHAFAQLLQRYPHLSLTIYGEGGDRARLEAMIHQLGLIGKVHLPGTVRQVQEELVKSDIFVFPSRYEGFPNALCEAMAVGLPVVASNCSGNVDVVRDEIDGRLFPVGDVNRLVELLQELIENPEERKRLGAHALEIPQRFSAEKIYAQWDEVMGLSTEA